MSPLVLVVLAVAAFALFSAGESPAAPQPQPAPPQPQAAPPGPQGPQGEQGPPGPRPHGQQLLAGDFAYAKQRLRDLGYNPGRATSHPSAADLALYREALSQFQARAGLPVTGSLDLTTLQRLRQPTAPRRA